MFNKDGSVNHIAMIVSVVAILIIMALLGVLYFVSTLFDFSF